jgi:hypothetical protein
MLYWIAVSATRALRNVWMTGAGRIEGPLRVDTSRSRLTPIGQLETFEAAIKIVRNR